MQCRSLKLCECHRLPREVFVSTANRAMHSSTTKAHTGAAGRHQHCVSQARLCMRQREAGRGDESRSSESFAVTFHAKLNLLSLIDSHPSFIFPSLHDRHPSGPDEDNNKLLSASCRARSSQQQQRGALWKKPNVR